MKNIIVFSFFAVAALIACNNTPKETQSPAASSSETAGSDGQGHKIVYVNLDTLLEKYELYQEKKKELEGQASTSEKAILAKIESFQKSVAKFQQEVMQIQQNAANIAPIELKKLEEKYATQEKTLAKQEQELMKQREDAASDLDKKLVDLQKRLKDNLDTYLLEIAEERGYDLILSKGAGGSVLYGRNSIDITEETVAAINKRYQAEKTSGK